MSDIDIREKEYVDQLDGAIADLWEKYYVVSEGERIVIGIQIQTLSDERQRAWAKLIMAGCIVNDDDIAEMKSLRKEIDEAKELQDIVVAVARTVKFVAKLAV